MVLVSPSCTNSNLTKSPTFFSPSVWKIPLKSKLTWTLPVWASKLTMDVPAPGPKKFVKLWKISLKRFGERKSFVWKFQKMTLTFFWQKYRESKPFTKEITKYVVDLTKDFFSESKFDILPHCGKEHFHSRFLRENQHFFRQINVFYFNNLYILKTWQIHKL